MCFNLCIGLHPLGVKYLSHYRTGDHIVVGGTLEANDSGDLPAPPKGVAAAIEQLLYAIEKLYRNANNKDAQRMRHHS